LGALPLSLEERQDWRSPRDRLDAPVAHDDPPDDDPTEFFTARRGCDCNRLGNPENARPVGIEGPDPVIVGQRGQGCTSGVPFGLVVGVA
jgi:hypothetical protein